MDTQNRHASVTAAMLSNGDINGTNGAADDEAKADFETEIEEETKSSFSLKRARRMAAPDAAYMLLGSIGAVFAGGVFPAWGIMFAQT